MRGIYRDRSAAAAMYLYMPRRIYSCGRPGQGNISKDFAQFYSSRRNSRAKKSAIELLGVDRDFSTKTNSTSASDEKKIRTTRSCQ